jgi:hypothetical protein
MTEAEQIMKRCQAGTRNYEEANNLHAACYGIIGKLLKQRTWSGLTDDEIEVLFQSAAGADEEVHIRFARAIETKLKDKNCVG